MPVYLAEQHVQRWTSMAIVRYFRRRRYVVRDWNLTQDLEKQVPTDWIFIDAIRLKIFGFQYKAVYSNGRDHWPLDRQQHDALQRFPWIYYAASEIRMVTDRRRALRLLRIYSPDIHYRPRLTVRSREVRYLRWATFFRAFSACIAGHRAASRSEFLALLGAISDTGPRREAQQMTEYFFVDFDRRRVVRAQRRLTAQ
jgi:hypothetical protein